jgi:hypothetical protein
MNRDMDEGCDVMRSSINNGFEGMYLLLMLDRLPNGLWGRSIPYSARITYGSEPIVGSPSSSGLAASALLEYVKDKKHPAIIAFEQYIMKHTHPKTGAIGLKGTVTTTRNEQIVTPNCRHTAYAAWFLFHLKEKMSKRLLDMVSFLINSQRSNGWGLTDDYEADPITTAIVLKLLILMEKYDIGSLLQERLARKLPTTITQGMVWFADNLTKGYWAHKGGMEDKFVTTAAILKQLPEFYDYFPKAHQEAFEILYEHFKLHDNGFPIETESAELDFAATACFLHTLAIQNMNYKTDLRMGLETMMKSMRTPELFLSTCTPDWATILELCTIPDVKAELDRKSREKLDEIIRDVLKNEAQINESKIYVRDFIPEEFYWLEDIMAKILLASDAEDKYAQAIDTVSNGFQALRGEVHEFLEKRFAENLKTLDEERKDDEQRLTVAEYSLGPDHAKALRETYRSKFHTKKKSLMDRRRLLLKMLENATSPKELEHIKELLKEWQSEEV